MGKDEKKKKDKASGGGYKWGSACIWAFGQWAVCWFITESPFFQTIPACVSAFFSGWTTSAFLGRFAKWGANAWVMMLLGVLIGVAVFSGAFSGITAAMEWWQSKNVKVEWDKLEKFLLSPAVLPPAVFGLFSGLYVRGKFAPKK